MKQGVSHYINILSSFSLSNVIIIYSREECCGAKTTKSCIDYIVTRINKLIVLSGVGNKVIADDYIAILFILGVVAEKQIHNTKMRYKVILDNNVIDNLCQTFK